MGRLDRRGLSRVAGLLLAVPVAWMGRASGAAAQPPAHTHRIALHVGGGDPVQMAVALHNIAAAADTYAAKGERVAIELVANGPGYTMLRADRSPVKDALAETHRRYPFVVFAACQMTRKGMAAAEGKQPADIPELPGVTDVPSGIVRLTTLQEQGWAYVRV